MICKLHMMQKLMYDQKNCEVQQEQFFFCIYLYFVYRKFILYCMFGQQAHLAYIVLPTPNRIEATPNMVEAFNMAQSSNKDQDTICTLQTPNKVNILNMILLFSGPFCGYHPHQSFPLARVSLVYKIWCYVFSFCMVMSTFKHNQFDYI